MEEYIKTVGPLWRNTLKDLGHVIILRTNERLHHSFWVNHMTFLKANDNLHHSFWQLSVKSSPIVKSA